MNLGSRIAGALSALSGSLSADVVANADADATFRETTEATLTNLGTLTTDLKTQIDAIAAQVANGEAVDPAVFADIKAKVDSLDEAFPDTDVAPPADDPAEEPIVDDGSEAPVDDGSEPTV